MCKRNIDRSPVTRPQPGTWLCPDQELNRWPFALQDNAEPTEPSEFTVNYEAE